MKLVEFPLINLKLQLNRIALKIGNIEIYWYAILITLAFIVSLLIYKKNNGKFEIKFADITDLAIFIIPISLISARLYYVVFNLNYYISNPTEIINTRSGGMAIYGGIIGGIITCFIFCKKRKIEILNLTDYLAPGLAIGQAIGRWGNFINVEAYGAKTNLPWRMGIYEAGTYIEVHPTFLYESIATFFIFIILMKISKNRKFKGQITYLYFIFYGFFRMLIEGLRRR